MRAELRYAAQRTGTYRCAEFQIAKFAATMDPAIGALRNG